MYSWNAFTTTWIYIPFSKNKEKIPIFKEPEGSRYIYQNQPHKAWSQHDMAFCNFKDLTRRAVSDKVLYDKIFVITRNPKNDGCQGGLPSIIHNVLDKTFAATRANKSATQTGTVINSNNKKK